MCPKSIILFFPLLIGFIKAQISTLHIPNKNSLQNFLETLSMSALHIHYITELDSLSTKYNLAYYYESSNTFSSLKVPCTIHNIFPNKIKSIKMNKTVMKLLDIKNEIKNEAIYYYRNLSEFKPLNINRMRLHFNSFSTVLAIILLSPVPPSQNGYNFGNPYDFCGIEATRVLLRSGTVAIPLLEKLTIYKLTREQLSNNYEENKEYFDYVVGQNRPMNMVNNADLYIQYYIKGIGYSDAYSAPYFQLFLMTKDVKVFYIKLDMVDGVQAFELKLQDYNHHYINQVIIEPLIPKIIYSAWGSNYKCGEINFENFSKITSFLTLSIMEFEIFCESKTNISLKPLSAVKSLKGVTASILHSEHSVYER